MITDATTGDAATELSARKRLVYLLISVPSLVSLAVLWALRWEDPFSRYAYPVYYLSVVWTIWALLSKKIPLVRVERLTFTMTALFWTVMAGYQLLNDATNSVQTGYFSLLTISVLAYLVLPNRQALGFTLGILAMALGFGLYRNYRSVSLLAASNLKGLVSFVMTQLAISGMVFALSHFQTALAKSQAESNLLKKLAHFDSLTGLRNRRKLTAFLGEQLESARRYERPLSVILFDIDHFKTVNDNYGHAVGDNVLSHFAYLLEPAIRASDVWGRWGGEEFLVVCPETDLPEASALAERLRVCIAEHRFDPAGRVTASFGVAEWQPGETDTQLLAHADAALYNAKAQGRNRVVRSLSQVAQVLTDTASKHQEPQLS